MATSKELRAYLTNPPTKVGDGQCVPFVRETLPLDGCPTGAYGNAVDWWTKTSPVLLDYYDKIPANQLNGFVTGDILIWGDDLGTFTGIYGHIARWLDGQIINQNNGGREFVTVDKYFSPGFLGILRLKGEIMKPTDQQIDEWISKQHYIGFGNPASPEVFDQWRPVLKNNFIDGSLSILAGIDTNPGALKNRPTPPSGNIGAGTYLKVDPKNVIEIK